MQIVAECEHGAGPVQAVCRMWGSKFLVIRGGVGGSHAGTLFLATFLNILQSSILLLLNIIIIVMIISAIPILSILILSIITMMITIITRTSALSRLRADIVGASHAGRASVSLHIPLSVLLHHHQEDDHHLNHLFLYISHCHFFINIILMSFALAKIMPGFIHMP